MADQYDPTDPIKTAGAPNPQGGLSAAPTGSQGVSPRSGLSATLSPSMVLQSMNPERMMSLLQTSTIPDEDVRRLKFLAGWMAPTKSGNIGEAMSNAVGAYAETAEKQKQLIAQYAPMMYQHLATTYGAAVTAEKNMWEKNREQAGILNDALTGLTNQDNVTPQMLSNTIWSAGNANKMNPDDIGNFIKDLYATGNPMQEARNRLMARMDPGKRFDSMFPDFKEIVDQNTGEKKWIQIDRVSGQPRGQGTQAQTSPKIEFRDAGNGKTIAVVGGKPLGFIDDPKVAQQLQQVTGPISVNGQQPGAQGAAPASPITTPGVTAPTTPATTFPSNGKGSDAERLKVLQDELAAEKDPAARAALQREIANASGGYTHPELMPYYTKSEALGMNPTKQSVTNEENMNKQFLAERQSADSEVSSTQRLVDRMNIMQNLLNQGVKTGGFFDFRTKAGSEVRDFLSSTGLLNQQDADALANKFTGNQVAAETFAKEVIPMMMAELKSEIASPQTGSFGGQRFTQMEWAKMIEAIANGKMTPGAINNLHMLAQRGLSIATDHQGELAKWGEARDAGPVNGTRLDLSQFNKYWGNRLKTNGTLGTHIQLGNVTHEVRTAKDGTMVSRPVGATGSWAPVNLSGQ